MKLKVNRPNIFLNTKLIFWIVKFDLDSQIRFDYLAQSVQLQFYDAKIVIDNAGIVIDQSSCLVNQTILHLTIIIFWIVKLDLTSNIVILASILRCQNSQRVVLLFSVSEFMTSSPSSNVGQLKAKQWCHRASPFKERIRND